VGDLEYLFNIDRFIYGFIIGNGTKRINPREWIRGLRLRPRGYGE